MRISRQDLARVGRGAQRRATSAVRTIPEPLAATFFPRLLGYRLRDIPLPVSAPHAETRLLIAPANYAGQGYLWARAASGGTSLQARNLEIVRPGGFEFAADFTVSEHIATLSRRWSRAQAAAVLGFTHVLIEAGRPILGRTCEGDVRAEADLLRAHGIVVGFVSHGSDLRRPSLHRDGRWSPFRDDEWELLPVLEQQTAAHAEVLRAEEHVFVVTPELLRDVPHATWFPNVVDVDAWRADRPIFPGSRPRVLHLPTSTIMKGSDLIDPVCHALDEEGTIEYVRPARVAPDRMRSVIMDADIVLEQFRLGIYSTTALEAMAAGRLVIGNVTEAVREHVRTTTGYDVPILQADPTTLADVLTSVARDPAGYTELAAAGPPFVRAVHDGRHSVQAISAFLDTKPEGPT